LIQKEQGRIAPTVFPVAAPLEGAAYQKQYLPTQPAGSHGCVDWLVYLTWNNIASRANLTASRQQHLTWRHQRY
jgi:hypothetical protein